MTTNNNYQDYIDSVLQLAETIVIKSSAAADALNQKLVEDYGASVVDSRYPSTWKYYLNLAGEYHPTDTVMTVVSMDTLEKITFSKANLKLHRATARGYAFGTRQYNLLVSQYPEQSLLIKGILNPVDIDEAIAADDGKILGYPEGLVEENEYSLIAKLQTWVDGFRARYVNEQFSISDSLYTPSWMGIMYMNLPIAIGTIRREACLTNEAHSYHVKQYLASHGHLDVYMDQLTTKQALWLYRNIRYLRNNTGKQENFEWLIEHIMTERNLPLAEYNMHHDVSVMAGHSDSSVMRMMALEAPVETGSLYPDIKFKKVPLNLGYNLTDDDPVTLGTVLAKEDHFARMNAKVRSVAQPQIQEAMENSLSNSIKTKFLESSMVDRSNNSPYTLADILLSHWLYLSVEGNYRAFIGVTSPKTGERIPLTVKDAYILVWYAFCQSNGIQIDTIPKVIAERVQRLDSPTVDDLMSMVDKKYVSRDMAEAILAPQPQIGDIISTEAFYNTALQIFDAAQVQRRLIASQEHAKRRGMVFNMVSRVYSDALCTLVEDGDDDSYKSWFAARNIDIDSYSQSELGLLYVNLVQEATGMNLVTTKSLKDLQSAMVRMLSQLSSYSIQINADINSSDLRLSDWGMIRIGDVKSDMNDEAAVEIVATVLKASSQLNDSGKFDVTRVTLGNDPVVKLNDQAKYEITAKVFAGQADSDHEGKFNAAPIRIRPIPAPKKNALGITPVLGIDQYILLPEEQRVDFNDVYGNKYVYTYKDTGPAVTLPPLSSIVPVTILNGLTYVISGPIQQTELSKSLRNTWLDGFDKT